MGDGVLIGRRQFIGGALAGAAGLVLLRSPGAQAAPPVSPRVAYGPDAARSMRLSWATPGNIAGLVAEIGPTAALGRTLAVETRTAPGYGVRYHHALADGLLPATTYHYRLAHTGGASTGTFRTAPITPERFRFVAFGDQGTSAAAAGVDNVVRSVAPALVFVVGDLSYASTTGGTDPAGTPASVNHGVWDGWLGLVSASSQGTVPWLAGVGNHEIEDGMGPLGYDGYLARVGLPGNGPKGVPTAWTVRYGNVAFINLDGNDVSDEIARIRGWTGGMQTRWLEATLSGLRKDPTIDWIVVGFHHCAYCSNVIHGSDGGVRRVWDPLFDRYAVDLVVNGHNHCYERAHPLRAGAVVGQVATGGTWSSAAGTTYLTAGGGGQVPYPTFVPGVSTVATPSGGRDVELALWSAVQNTGNSLLAIDVTPPGTGGTTSLLVRTLSAAGAEVDRLTLVRQHTAAVAGAGTTAPTSTTAPTRSTPAARPARGELAEDRHQHRRGAGGRRRSRRGRGGRVGGPTLDGDEPAGRRGRSRLAVRRLRLQQAGAEEVEDLVEGGPGRLAGLVDQVLGDDRVRVLHRGLRVGGAVVELDGHEPVAELVLQVLEPLARHELVALEAQAEHLEAVLVAALLDAVEVGAGAVDRAPRPLADGDGHRRLGEHRREQAVVGGHRQRVAAGEAHPDGPDARAAAALVLLLGQGPQPADDR